MIAYLFGRVINQLTEYERRHIASSRNRFNQFIVVLCSQDQRRHADSRKGRSIICCDLMDDISITTFDNYISNCWAEFETVSYTHLRAHETVLDLVCRLLL